MLLAVILTTMSVLGMAPAALTKVKAAPDGSTAISPDQDEISVLSVVVNVNTGTENIFTELILHNNSAEEKEVTFALPKISSGMDLDSLKLNTNNGRDLETDNGVVTLKIKAGGDAGVSYSYKSRTALSCERTILFDLKPLAAQFSDRIGHLEWLVDMPEYELVLVEAIHPMNYMVADNRISVKLDNFLVSDLLDRVYVSRTTHQELLTCLEQYEEDKALIYESWAVESGWTEKELEDAKRELNGEISIYRFLLQHYREWFRDPAFKDTAQYYQEKYDDFIFEEDYQRSKDYKDQIHMPGSFYSFITPDRIYWGNLMYESDLLNNLYELINYLTREEEGHSYYSSYSPAMRAQLYPDTPAVYVELMDYPQEVLGKTILSYEHGGVIHTTAIPGGLGYYDEFYNCYGTGNAVGITSDRGYIGEYDGYGENQRIRMVRLLGNRLTDPEVVQDYLNALKVKAVIRYEYFVTPFDEPFTPDVKTGLSEELIGNFEYSHYWMGYCGNESYPYETFREDLRDLFSENNGISLLRRTGSVENVWNVPVITQYVGRFFSAQDLKNSLNDDPGKGKTIGASFTVDSIENVYIWEDCWFYFDVNSLDPLLDRPTPTQLLNDRDEALQVDIEKNETLLRKAREELNLPSQQEMGMVQKDESLKDIHRRLSLDEDEITIRSLTINVDLKTDIVTTKLVLHSNKTEDTEVIFLLPEIEAGIGNNTLDVKTDAGDQARRFGTEMLLPVKAGGDAELIYTYKTWTSLANREKISFDLSSLAEKFHDRIEYFSWNVDLTQQDQLFLREVHPGNYTVTEQGISVELKDVLVTDHPDGVFLTRANQEILRQEISTRYYDEAMFIIDRYPEWFKDPEFYQYIIHDESSDGVDRSTAYTVINLYLRDHYSEEKAEVLFNAYLNGEDYETVYTKLEGRLQEAVFDRILERCAKFEALMLGDLDNQDPNSERIRKDLNLIFSVLMEWTAPENPVEPSSDEAMDHGSDIDGTEADSTKTPASPTGSPSEDPAPSERSPLPVILIIAGVVAVLAAITFFVIRKLKR